MNLAPLLKQRFFDSNGNPLDGGKLYSYQAGTTTPQATYTDSTGVTPNANPLVLDANGECALWLDPALSYKFTLTDADDVTQWTVDNVLGLLETGSVVTASIANDAVTQAKIADDAVGADQLKDSVGTDADRAVTTNHIRDGAVTQAKRAALGQQVSTSCGAYAVGTTTADVTNLSVSITTTGRPVMVMLIADPASAGKLECISSAGSVCVMGVYLMRGSTQIAALTMASPQMASYSQWPVSSIATVDVPAAGTYTYKVRAARLGGTSAAIENAQLVVFEL
jgi:hypothetical protein